VTLKIRTGKPLYPLTLEYVKKGLKKILKKDHQHQVGAQFGSYLVLVDQFQKTEIG
jgi:hypothetical protein